MRTSEQTTKLIAALVAARRAFKPVIRDAVAQVGPTREYRYTDLAGLLDATLPALLEHGVIVLQAVDGDALLTRLEHTSGEWCESAYPLPLGLPPQQFGSALTYGRRYSLQSLLCVASEDDDDGASAQPTSSKKKPKDAAPVKPTPVGQPKSDAISLPQRKRMFAIATKAGWSTEQMKDHLRLTYGIESSKDLPIARYDQVCADFERPPVAAADMPF